MSKMIILGERGLPLAKAGQTSWQRPHSMQASASRRSFQVRSAAFSSPNVSAVLEVDGRNRPADSGRAEDEVERAREHVQVLGMGDVGDEAVDEEDVEPPADLEMGGDGGGREAGAGDGRGQGRAEERQALRAGMMGDRERLEIEIAERDEDERGIDDRRIPRRRRVGLGPEDEPAEGEKGDADEDEDGEDVDEQGKDVAERAAAEEDRNRGRSLRGCG